MSDDEIIEEFMNVICDGGTPVADCDLCKKTWYAQYGEYMDEGELEQMTKKRVESPDKYAATSDSSVSYGHAFGYQFVYGCRCEKARKIILRLWEHRGMLLTAFERIKNAQIKDLARLSERLEAAK